MKNEYFTGQPCRRAIFRKSALSILSVSPLLVAILGAPAPAHAQAAPAEPVEQVVITGTRVVRDGYQAPTPVSVISADEFQNSATPNVADFLNTLPSLAGSSTPQTTSNSVFNNGEGINGLNLRGLGAVRTLVLMDGQRVGGAINTGVVDISEIPQQLISRVDVVTGGASAAYGSDALAGVVNFVMDHNFTGFKGELSGGLTDYGDDANWKGALTYGREFDGGRGHIILSGEATDERGIINNNRPWNLTGLGFLTNPAYTPTNGQPLNLLLTQVGLSNATTGGEIACTATSSCAPLRGIAFGPGGSPYNVVFGSVVSDPFMSGGTWQGPAYVRNTQAQALQPPQRRQTFLGRVSYELFDGWNVYGQAQWSHVEGSSRLVPIFFPGTLSIKADNAYIPAAIASQVTALGISSFPFGTMNGDLPSTGYLMDRALTRFVLGIDGSVNLFGTEWKVSAYAESSLSQQHASNTNTISVPKYMQAIDAVRAPNGSIVCRSTLTAPGDGCVPYDVFGTGVNSQAAVNYVTGSPFNNDNFLQQAVSVSITGEPFSLWAGPVSFATGIEHREESGHGVSDPFETPPVPWFFSAGLPTVGQFDVTEGFVETVVPLAEDESWAKNLDFNGAVRVTGYSSGTVVTWKAGLTYAPFDDIRFRFTESHDIREPNLNDLFMGAFTTTSTVNDPYNSGASAPLRYTTSGNSNLTPESSYTSGLGVVVQPTFIPGFNASFDYYAINISQGIGTLNAQQEVNLCFNGNQAFCNLVQRSTAGGAASYTVSVAPVNLASEHASGFDIEASYHFSLEDIVQGWMGEIGIRGLATHYINDTVVSGVPGSIPVQQVGNNSAAFSPNWRYDATLSYTANPIMLTFTMRGVSAGTYSNNNIECTTGCPTSTGNNPTVSNNRIPGATYFDLGMSYALPIETQAELFLNVRNIANSDPAPFAQQTAVGYVFELANPALYDILGRVYRVGVRFKT